MAFWQLEMACFAEAHGRLAPFWELLGDYERRVDWREGVKEGGREWKAVVRCKKKNSLKAQLLRA